MERCARPRGLLTPSNSEINLGIGVDTCGDRGGIMRDVRSQHPVKIQSTC
jgi:hypothetical protein